jgi:2-polyprenyl-3-methyl-5-hydroxy-6-metoxy-1,4-benzoquinol methylase
LKVALNRASRLNLSNAQILEVGCGTGWLGAELTSFGRVTGVDLSQHSIEEGRRRHPAVELICGDFLEIDVHGPFDFVVTADAFAHFYDQRRFVERISELLTPSGRLLLMTQNGFVWDRRSRRAPRGTGQIQVWPRLPDIRSLLSPFFTVEHVGSIMPGGDKGVLWWVENRYLRGSLRRARLLKPWDALLERGRLGRELVIDAVRATTPE